MNELFQHSDEGHQSSDDDVSGDSSQAENSSAEEQAMFKSLSPRQPVVVGGATVVNAPTSPFGGRTVAKDFKLSILLEEKEGEDQDDSLHVDAMSSSKKMIKVSQVENPASDAQEEIKQEMVDVKDIDRDFDNLRPNPTTQDAAYKQPRTVSHQQILTTVVATSESTHGTSGGPNSSTNPREMTLTKKAMQVASTRDPSKSNVSALGAHQKRAGGVVRNSEAKPVLNDLLEDRKVLSRSLAETQERINEIESEKRALHEVSSKLTKHIWLPKVICIFSPYNYYDKYVEIVEQLVREVQSSTVD